MFLDMVIEKKFFIKKKLNKKIGKTKFFDIEISEAEKNDFFPKM